MNQGNRAARWIFKVQWLLLIFMGFLVAPGSGLGKAHEQPSAPNWFQKSRSLGAIPDATRQIIVVEPGGESKAILQLYEGQGSQWTLLNTFSAVVGKKGVAPFGQKVEGDGRTPSGIYSLPLSFGYAPKIKTKMDYRQSTREDKYIDDPNSPDYNTWVRGSTTARSFELMRRPDNLYEYGILVNYNVNPIIPGKGSAIFLHVWRGEGFGTAGCIAVEKNSILKILGWLNPARNPYIVILESGK